MNNENKSAETLESLQKWQSHFKRQLVISTNLSEKCAKMLSRPNTNKDDVKTSRMLRRLTKASNDAEAATNALAHIEYRMSQLQSV